MEKYVQRARHVEVQVFGDGAGTVAAFPERECSIQVRFSSSPVVFCLHHIIRQHSQEEPTVTLLQSEVLM